jgi:pimeloyl-ACP methyl ester carboxylesterase
MTTMARMAPQKVVLHSHELSYVDSGSGPVVLFLHGILGSQRQWARLVDKMDDDHRVIVPDLFGHGDSAKPMGDYSLSAHAATMRDLLDHLEIERVTLVGHSLGGGIAMQFFYLFPERVDRLVLVSSGGLGREVNLILRSATLPGAAQVLSLVASTHVLSRVEALGRGASKVGWRPGADLTAIWQGFSSLSDRESRHAFLATTRAVIDIGGQSISAYDHLEGVLPPPTLLVWGSKDRMIPAWHALSAQSAVPECRIELFEGAGHFPHLEDTGRFARVLRQFIATGATEDTRPPQTADQPGRSLMTHVVSAE